MSEDGLNQMFCCPNQDPKAQYCSNEIFQASFNEENTNCTCLESKCLMQPAPAFNISCSNEFCYNQCWGKHAASCINMDDAESQCVYYCMDYCINSLCNPLFPRIWTHCELKCKHAWMDG